MIPETLSEYVLGRMRTGITKTELHEELTALGWTEDETEEAYRAAVVALGAPVPSEGNRATLSRKASTVDVVINFFSFILLGIVASALGTLLFQVINLQLPDALDSTNWYGTSAAMSSIHYSIAALLIGFPLYFFAMRLWFRKFREDEGRTESKLSKWLTYLVLLVTAVTIVGDLIAIVFTFLQGEITVRFFLKALVILAIAGAIFGFYYLERKKIQYHVDIARSTFQNFGKAVALVVVLAIGLGFVAGGSPSSQRNRTFDQTRADNLSTLSSCIEQYTNSLGMLPESLAELKQSSQYSYCSGYMTDPETALPYEYRVVTPSRTVGMTRVGEFELCATFALTMSPETRANNYVGNTVWHEHGSGRSCDTVTAPLGQNFAPSMLTPTSSPVPLQGDQFGNHPKDNEGM